MTQWLLNLLTFLVHQPSTRAAQVARHRDAAVPVSPVLFDAAFGHGYRNGGQGCPEKNLLRYCHWIIFDAEILPENMS